MSDRRPILEDPSRGGRHRDAQQTRPTGRLLESSTIRKPEHFTSIPNDEFPSHAASIPSNQYVWYVVFLLFVVNVVNYMDRMALSVLLPFIKADLHLSDGQLGLLAGLAFFVFYAVCGIPIARWADRSNRRNIIAIALATWSVMTALNGAAQNFWQLFLARVGVGVGESGCLPPAQSMLCDYVPLKRRSGIFSIHSLGLFAGMMVGMASAGWLAETIGWRWAFVTLGAPGILLAVIVKLTLREPVRGFLDHDSRSEPRQLPLTETLLVLWRCRTYRLLMLVLVTGGFTQYGLNQWWPSFYARVFGLSISSVGVYLGIGIGVGSAIGMLIGGLVSDRLMLRDVRWPLFMGVGGIILSFPVVLSSLFVSSAVSSILLASLGVLLWSLPAGPIINSVFSVTTPRMRATASALSIFFTSVLGFALGPVVVGVLSDALTPLLGAEALRFSLLAPVCALPVMVTLLYAAAKQLPADMITDGMSASSVHSSPRAKWYSRTEGVAKPNGRP